MHSTPSKTATSSRGGLKSISPSRGPALRIASSWPLPPSARSNKPFDPHEPLLAHVRASQGKLTVDMANSLGGAPFEVHLLWRMPPTYPVSELLSLSLSTSDNLPARIAADLAQEVESLIAATPGLPTLLNVANAVRDRLAVSLPASASNTSPSYPSTYLLDRTKSRSISDFAFLQLDTAPSSPRNGSGSGTGAGTATWGGGDRGGRKRSKDFLTRDESPSMTAAPPTHFCPSSLALSTPLRRGASLDLRRPDTLTAFPSPPPGTAGRRAPVDPSARDPPRVALLALDVASAVDLRDFSRSLRRLCWLLRLTGRLLLLPGRALLLLEGHSFSVTDGVLRVQSGWKGAPVRVAFQGASPVGRRVFASFESIECTDDDATAPLLASVGLEAWVGLTAQSSGSGALEAGCGPASVGMGDEAIWAEMDGRDGVTGAGVSLSGLAKCRRLSSDDVRRSPRSYSNFEALVTIHESLSRQGSRHDDHTVEMDGGVARGVDAQRGDQGGRPHRPSTVSPS